MTKVNGYHGVILDLDLSGGQISKKEVAPEDYRDFVGGRGLGAKLLWDALPGPGVDATSPQNPLIFMAGPFSGFPLPSASRTCVVTKSPITAAKQSEHEHASTITYANMGGFFAPEIRFAGYDGIMIRGRADHPVYLRIHNSDVHILDARKYWGMGTDRFDREFADELGNRRYQTCYIGPAGENLVPYGGILHTAARTAGRGGTGCVMGSKNLKAIAIRGTGQPNVAAHKRFVELLEQVREGCKDTGVTQYGTSVGTVTNSRKGLLVTKNFREGSFEHASRISGIAAQRAVWQRHFACFVCPSACKKAGVIRSGPYAGVVHDGPEYENSAMLGSNLLVDDLTGMLRACWHTDDLGLDAISAGNTIGFLMEAYDKRLIDRRFLDGIDLTWGNVDAVHQMLHKIARRDGVGDEAAKGVRYLANKIGQDSHKFAIHCKGQALAAWNCQADAPRALCYVTSNRGACHLNGTDPVEQNDRTLADSIGVCLIGYGKYGKDQLAEILEAIMPRGWSAEEYLMAGERVFNLEKCFNYREGFRRPDDEIADRFFEDPYTTGPKAGAVLNREEFEQLKTAYYKQRGWDPKTTRPRQEKLKQLGLDFVGLA